MESQNPRKPRSSNAKSAARPDETANGFFYAYPKHRHISELLRKRILTQMKPSERIPPEVVLSGEFGVSRETLRQALATLQKEGLISRTRGRGSFVSDRQLVGPPPKVTGVAEDFVSPALKTHWRLLQQTFLNVEGEVATYLGLEPGAPVVRFDRLKLLDNEPLGYHIAFLVLDAGNRILEQKLYLTSISASLANTLGFSLEDDLQMVEADVADVTLSKVLRIPIGSPLLQIRRLFITKGGRKIAYFKSYFRSDRYMYTVNIHRPNVSFVEPVRKKLERYASEAGLELRNK